MKRKILGFTAMALLLAGCAGGTPRLGEADTPPPPGLEVVRNAPLPPQVREGMANGARPYHIGPFDRLIIDVFGVEDMRLREIQVDASGRVAFPLAGSIDANGLTPGELADA
ncbi:MAG: polysaccharide biosynthesis/export family protein, partial [Sphingopyxis sp.]|nr:polysaccharide biosynthesis/export family protein [Sphingopyxis sp.]